MEEGPTPKSGKMLVTSGWRRLGTRCFLVGGGWLAGFFPSGLSHSLFIHLSARLRPQGCSLYCFSQFSQYSMASGSMWDNMKLSGGQSEMLTIAHTRLVSWRSKGGERKTFILNSLSFIAIYLMFDLCQFNIPYHMAAHPERWFDQFSFSPLDWLISEIIWKCCQLTL